MSSIYESESSFYDLGSRSLLFVAGEHTVKTGEDNRFIRFLKGTIEDFRPETVLIEQPRDMVINSQNIKNGSDAEREISSWRNEIDWIVYYCNHLKIPVMGMDVGENEKAESTSRKYGLDTYLLIWFLYLYSSVPRRYKTVPKEYYYDLAVSDTLRITSAYYQLFSHDIKRELEGDLRQGKSTLTALENILNKASLRKIGLPLQDALMTLKKELEISPYLLVVNGSGYEITKALKDQETLRNKAMIDTCIQTLKNDKKVMAIAGGGHLSEIRDELTKKLNEEFGTCKVITPYKN